MLDKLSLWYSPETQGRDLTISNIIILRAVELECKSLNDILLFLKTGKYRFMQHKSAIRRMLKVFEQNGIVENPKKDVYIITEDGKRFLDLWRKFLGDDDK